MNASGRTAGRSRAEKESDLAALLPSTRDYFTYGGSLTTPGCDEGGAWFVLTQPIAAPPAQLVKLGPFGASARQMQPRNGRPIVHVLAEAKP